MSLNIQLKSLSHHAYCIVGGDSIVNELILVLENEHKIKSHGNPDFFNRKYETFTIDDARELKSSHEVKAVNEYGKKIFITTMNGITAEAQNALLKLLEEPTENTHFFIVIPGAHLLLPTVKSRILFIETENIGNQADKPEEIAGLKEAKKFIGMSVVDRLEFIKSFIDDIKNEKKTKQDVINLLNTIQSLVYKEKGVVKGKEDLQVIETARKYMNDPAPSLKMLLEYTAVNIKS
ncbi:MAG: hypothetical protein WC666_00430 [Candidatus Paceibacterota bacterium]|jgi:DNA polymerase-3 subunit delta'